MTAEKNTVRLFIASSISGAAQTRLETVYQERLTCPAPSESKAIAWVLPENWHLTWLFFGDVPTETVPLIQEQLGTVLQGVSACQVDLSQNAIWPKRGTPKVWVWSDPNPDASALGVYQTLRSPFDAMTDSKPFKPHVTFARFRRKPETPLPELQRWADSYLSHPQTFHIETIQLMQSTLTPQRAVYSVLDQWTLGKE